MYEGTEGLTDVPNGLKRDYVFRLGTFLSLGDSEFNFLAFGKSFEPIPSDCTEVHEYIRSGFL